MSKYPILSGLISRGEGSYNSVNYSRNGPKNTWPPKFKVLTQMSIQEILDAQRKKLVFAVGRYQLIPNTFKRALENVKIPSSTLFSPAIQDRLFDEYLIDIRRKEVAFYMTRCNYTNRSFAIQQLAREWAAIGLEFPEAGRDRGSSRYPPPTNYATILPEEISCAIDAERRKRGCSIPSGEIPQSQCENFKDRIFRRKYANQKGYKGKYGGRGRTGGASPGSGSGRLQSVSTFDNREFDESPRIEEELPPTDGTIELKQGEIDDYERESESSIFEEEDGFSSINPTGVVTPSNTSQVFPVTIGNRRSLSILETNDTNFLGQDAKEKTPVSSEGSEFVEDNSLVKEQEKKQNNKKEPLNINGNDRVLFSTWVYEQTNKSEIGGIEFRGNISHHYSANNTILYT